MSARPLDLNSPSTLPAGSRPPGWTSTPPLSPKKPSLGSTPVLAVNPVGFTNLARTSKGTGIPQVIPVRATRGKNPSFNSSQSSLHSADSGDTTPSSKVPQPKGSNRLKPTSLVSGDSDSSRSHCSRASHASVTHSAASMARPKQLPSVPASAEHRHRQRRKQILFGKVTDGYRNYRHRVPTFDRQPSNPSHPMTPNAFEECSKRRWDAAVGAWRRALHLWDNPPDAAEFRINHAPTLVELEMVPAEPLAVYEERTTRELEALRNEVNRWGLKGSNASDATSDGSVHAQPCAPFVSDSSRTDHSARDMTFNLSGTSGVIGQSLDAASGQSTPRAVRNFDPFNYLPDSGLSAAHSRTTDDVDDGSRSDADDRATAFRSWQKQLECPPFDRQSERCDLVHAATQDTFNSACRLSDGSGLSSARVSNNCDLTRLPLAWVAGLSGATVPCFALWVQNEEDSATGLPTQRQGSGRPFELPLVSAQSADQSVPLDAEGAVDAVNAFMRRLNFRFDLRTLFWYRHDDRGLEQLLQPLAATVKSFEAEVVQIILAAVAAPHHHGRQCWRDLSMALPQLVCIGPPPHSLGHAGAHEAYNECTDPAHFSDPEEDREIAELVREAGRTVGSPHASGNSPDFTVNLSLLMRATSSSSSADGSRSAGALHFGSAALMSDSASWSPIGAEG